jgi:hypothetical protein
MQGTFDIGKLEELAKGGVKLVRPAKPETPAPSHPPVLPSSL